MDAASSQNEGCLARLRTIEQFGVSEDEITHAAELLRDGKLVAFPTETVYGLGANALDAEAVARIFEVKGRPNSSPIIVHVSSHGDDRPSGFVMARESAHPGRTVLARTVDVGCCENSRRSRHRDSWSAYRGCAHAGASGRFGADRGSSSSHSSAQCKSLHSAISQHRRACASRTRRPRGLHPRWRPCAVGIESTVLSLAGDVPILLRPGAISRTQIEELIGEIALAEQNPTGSASFARDASPPLQPTHAAIPRA